MPAPTVSPSVAPAAPSAPASTGNIMEDVIGSAWSDTLVEQGTDATTLTRDASGRFQPRDREDAIEREDTKATRAKDVAKDGKPAEHVESAPDAGDAKTDGKPDGPVVLEAADPSTLATKFTLKDADGELDIPKGLTIAFQANGRERVEPLDRVVKFAQMGVYNHEREQRVLQTEARSQEIETYATSLESQVREREQQMEQLLRDPAFRERAIAEYEGLQTPEAKAERRQRELDERDAEQQRTGLRQRGEQYFTTQIVPAVDLLVKATPNVTPDEIHARLQPFVHRLRGPLGLVPPDRYDAINQHFLTDVIPWAQQLDEHRALERGTTSGRQQGERATAAAKAKDADVEAANVRAQKARRLATANLKPAGRGASPTPARTKAPTTVSEIMDDVIAQTKLASGMG